MTRALTSRFQRLTESGQIRFFDEEETVVIFLVGDAGGGYVKIGLAIGNVRNRPNSTSNLLLIGAFKGFFYVNFVIINKLGEEGASNLRQAFSGLAEQLNAFSTLCGHPVSKFATADLMFLSKAYGHLGPAALYSCVWCECPCGSLSELREWVLRTPEKMELDSQVLFVIIVKISINN